MSTANCAQPDIVGAEEWAEARAELLAAEKEVTRAEDAVAARRRRLPMVRFRSDYEFAGPVTALVRLHCAIGPRYFTDLLTLIHLDGRWQIIAKVFHYEETGAAPA